MELHLQEIKKILQGLSGLKIVGADVVEVAPAYDTQGEQVLLRGLFATHRTSFINVLQTRLPKSPLPTSVMRFWL